MVVTDMAYAEHEDLIALDEHYRNRQTYTSFASNFPSDWPLMASEPSSDIGSEVSSQESFSLADLLSVEEELDYFAGFEDSGVRLYDLDGTKFYVQETDDNVRVLDRSEAFALVEDYKYLIALMRANCLPTLDEAVVLAEASFPHLYRMVSHARDVRYSALPFEEFAEEEGGVRHDLLKELYDSYVIREGFEPEAD